MNMEEAITEKQQKLVNHNTIMFHPDNTRPRKAKLLSFQFKKGHYRNLKTSRCFKSYTKPRTPFAFINIIKATPRSHVTRLSETTNTSSVYAEIKMEKKKITNYGIPGWLLTPK